MGITDSGTDQELALQGIAAMEAFYRSIGMPTSLEELGIAPTGQQIEELAEKCALACGGSAGSVKKLYREDMRNIYEMAR